MTSAPAIGFEYLPSPSVRRVLILICLLALTAIVVCAAPSWLKALLVAASAGLTGLAIRRWSTPAAVAVGWSRDSDWTLRLRDSSDVSAALLSFRVMGAFILLRLRTDAHGVQVVLLAPDNSDPDIRRRLRMRLATMQPVEALPRL
jgi:toxin CptA